MNNTTNDTPVNYSEGRRKQDAAYKKESNFTAIKKAFVEQDLNLVLDSLKIAQHTLDVLVQEKGLLLSMDMRVTLLAQASRCNDLYLKLSA